MSGFYHQDERDRAVGIGMVALASIAAIIVVLCVVACRSVRADPMDGSTAGRNAVTAEQIVAQGGVAYVKRDGDPPYMDRALYEVPDGVESYVVLDRWNNTEYILVKCGDSVALTPRLDNDGKVIVMPQE
jgi:hypothetical protein